MSNPLYERNQASKKMKKCGILGVRCIVKSSMVDENRRNRMMERKVQQNENKMTGKIISCLLVAGVLLTV